MKKILVTGHTGFLGNYLCKQAPLRGINVLGLSRNPGSQSGVDEIAIDLENPSFIEKLLDLEFDGIIHLAANGNVGDCEERPALSRLINVVASQKLARLANERIIPFVFTSSDQVFDGIEGSYSPTHQPKPLNQYGHQKLEAESKILEEHPAAVICRMPLMIGEEGGYERAFVENLRAGKEQNLFTDELRSVLNVQQAAEWLLEALNWEGGIYHLPGPKDMNRYELGVYLAKKHGLDLSLIKPGKQSDVNLSVRRPKNATMVR